jgi:osmoprotectant transport system permease protein
MSPAVTEAVQALPPLLRGHIALSGAALALAALVGLPLALLASRSAWLRTPLLGLVNVIQTIPALALLALFYPLLVLLRAATGMAIAPLGFLPALIALTLYALLPMLRNTIAAMDGTSPVLREAAEALGMGFTQRLRLVELPLAAPVILAGLRTAATWVIGTATLATTIGQPSLGNLIFAGLQTENWAAVLVGCCAAAALALAVDGALALVASGLARRARWRVIAGLAALAIGLVLALVPGGNAASQGRVVVIGAKNFSEQYILASLIEARLHRAGIATARRDDLGSAVAYRALAAGDIDVYVDYTGTLWTNVLARKDNPPPAAMRAELGRELARRDQVLLLGALGFENAYALAMRRSEAAQKHVVSIADLSREAPQLTLASDLEFLSRPEWRAVAAAYGLHFAASRAYNPTFMYRALADGSADVMSAFSSDGRIAALDLVTLADPAHALPNYDAVLLLSPRLAADAKAVAALRPLIGAIPLDRMRRANYMVDRDADKRSPAEAAAWLDPPK